jgi:chromosome segregation ATPase
VLLSYSHHINYQVSVDNKQILKQELAALQHELRRVNDAIERNRTRDMEKRARLLSDNIALCEAQLKQLVTPLHSADN